MASHYLRKYGVQTTIPFELYETDGTDLKTDAVHASGDTKIMKDEGDEANTENAFTDEGQGYAIVLSATEMTAARVVVYVVDQGTKAWLDKVLIIDTYGNASAEHAFDLDTATVNLSSTTETQIDNIETDTNEIQGKLPTNKIMGSSVVTDKDDEIDAIKAKTDLIGASVALESGGNLAAVKAKTDLIGASVALESGGNLAAVLADTNELQTDWANGGRLDLLLDAAKEAVDTEVAAIKAVTDTLSLTAIADAVLDEVTEGTTTLRHVAKILMSVLAGKSSGGGTATLKFRDVGDAKDRVTATVDADGNRTAMTLDAT